MPIAFIGMALKLLPLFPAIAKPQISPCCVAFGSSASTRSVSVVTSKDFAQSPAAKMSGIFVSPCALVWMPRAASRPRLCASSVAGRTPTAITSSSNSTSLPLCMMALPGSNRAALSPSRNVTSCASQCFCTICAASASRIDGSTCFAKSQTVTLATRSRMPSRHFMPIKPAPTISTRVFFARQSASSRASLSVMNV